MNPSKLDPTMPGGGTSILRRERDSRPYCLEQFEGEGSPRNMSLDRAEMLIGRGNDCDIRVPSQRASRQHAALTRKGTDYIITDKDSHNGVFLNGVKIHSAVLRDGDIIQLADCAFVYREG